MSFKTVWRSFATSRTLSVSKTSSKPVNTPVNFVTALLLSTCAALVHNLLYWLVFLVIPGYDGAVSALVRFYLPASLYAVLFLPLFFFPLRALGRKLKNPLSTNEEPSVIL